MPDSVNPYPSETHFRRLDWRPGKRRRCRPRVRDYGGQKAAPLAFRQAALVNGFGRGSQRRCEHCRAWAMAESRFCRAHGGMRWAKPGSVIPRRLREARGNPKAAAKARREGTRGDTQRHKKARRKGMKRDTTLGDKALISLAKRTLQAVCREAEAPAAARAQAARTLLEMTGVLRDTKRGDTGKALSEMTAAEVEAKLKALSAGDGDTAKAKSSGDSRI